MTDIYNKYMDLIICIICFYDKSFLDTLDESFNRN